jgi:pyruvate-formate lyase-activating enzyme
VRYCNTEVFIIVHNKDSNKLFSFTSDKTFNLGKISDLVLRDIKQNAVLQKNKKFEGEDFDRIRKNINEIERVNQSYVVNHAMQQEIMDRNEDLLCTNEVTETETNNDTFHKSPILPSNEMSSASNMKDDKRLVSANRYTNRIKSPAHPSLSKDTKDLPPHQDSQRVTLQVPN